MRRNPIPINSSRRKRFKSIAFGFSPLHSFFLTEYTWTNILCAGAIYPEGEIFVLAVLSKTIGNLSAFCFSRLLERIACFLERGKEWIGVQVTATGVLIYKQVSTVLPGFLSACFLLFMAFRTFFLGPSSIWMLCRSSSEHSIRASKSIFSLMKTGKNSSSICDARNTSRGVFSASSSSQMTSSSCQGIPAPFSASSSSLPFSAFLYWKSSLDILKLIPSFSEDTVPGFTSAAKFLPNTILPRPGRLKMENWLSWSEKFFSPRSFSKSSSSFSSNKCITVPLPILLSWSLLCVFWLLVLSAVFFAFIFKVSFRFLEKELVVFEAKRLGTFTLECVPLEEYTVPTFSFI